MCRQNKKYVQSFLCIMDYWETPKHQYHNVFFDKNNQREE